MKNILITSAGKRVKLVRIFQKTIRDLGFNAKVYTTDMKPSMAPAGIVSDGCLSVPKCTADGFINDLLDICKEKEIGVIIPTIDPELIVLSNNRQKFKEIGVELMLSETGFIQICRDKRKTSSYFSQIGIAIPKLLDKYHPVFPMFAKPYDGSLSTNIHFIKNESALTKEILDDEKLLFMEYIDKAEYQEFTVDMYFGLDHKVKSIVPRERIEVRAGEINKGITRKNYIVDFLKQRMGYLPGVRGCICAQLFYRESDNDIKGIEINPRFGGGYPLTYYAKANYAEYVIKEYLLHEEITYNEDWLDNTLLLRFDDDIIVYEKNVVAFDLDDTLYKEVDFLRSAFWEIAEVVKTDDSPKSVFDFLWRIWLEGGDPFGRLVEQYKLDDSKESLILRYRNHIPKIYLDPNVEKTLKSLKAKGYTICLISDGRSVTQRNKIKALGLDEYVKRGDIVISEELGFDKHSSRPFEAIADQYKNAKFFYIGDNTKKDFYWPNLLGWTTICLKDDGRNIHKQEDVDSNHKPKYTIDQLPDILPIVTMNIAGDKDTNNNSLIKRIAIYGAGGLGREVAGGIKRINNSSKGEKWELVGFYDDRLEPGTQVSHYGEVLGGMAELNKLKEPLALAIAVGSPSTRKLIFERITNPNISFPNLIAPSFKILDPETFKIGRGNIIQDNCSATCDVTIGDFNVLNGSDILGHDDKIGNFNVIMPGVHLSGDVKIGECNLLGVNSVVLQQIKIGDNVTLGAGSVLMTKPKDGYTYIGTPAKKFDYK